MDYDPKLSALISQADADWGNPEVNLSHIVKYNIGVEFDKAMWGVDLIDGELIVVQAPKKARKSTFAANLCLNFAPQLRMMSKWMCIDTLESGMTPKAYRDVLAAIMTTKILISKVYGNERGKWPSVDEIIANPFFKDAPLNITRRFLRFGYRTDKQMGAIEEAKKILSVLPISIFGSAKNQGEARSIEAAMDRWDKLYNGTYPKEEEKEHVIFITDNVQQYREFAGNSYQGLETITNHIATFVTSHPGSVVIAISQVSMGSQRMSITDGMEMEVRGGTRLAEEAVTVFQTRYDKNAPLHLIIETPFSRYEPPATMVQDIEPNSGAFLAPAIPLYATKKK